MGEAGRQGEREGEHKPQVIDSSWVKANKGFPGSFRSGGSYLGATGRARIKGAVCSVEGMEAERVFYAVHEPQVAFIVFDPSCAGSFSSTVPA